ncbi:hypothetical protein [Niabella ginsengisoli]|uniref:Carbamoyl-phosphate synthetase large subunit oligomerisation domain-containing protein n=1 Tax=Niabella ginsengisoli TaxID=522298 RepID=A0ABS9SNE8_9BACT|nr:hypothetical protein [Niabella ginsengisoli]MCH5599674.1 hypothetical protein [Niabella ginsengisoli]
MDDLTTEMIREAKVNGFSDAQIATLIGAEEDEVYAKRKSLGINRVYKMVDTCSAEFEAKTPYFYSTFDSPSLKLGGDGLTHNESKLTDKKK